MRALHIEMRAGSPDEIVGLDRVTLDETARELETLGFEQIGDLVLCNSPIAAQIAAPISDPSVEQPPPPTRLKPQILSRVSFHPQHGCLGIVHAMVLTDTKGKRAPKAKSWVSFHSFAQEDWSYSTTNYRPSIAQDKVTRVCHRPRALWTRMPKATLEQLVQKHLERRQQIAREARIEWAPNPTAQDYIESEQDWTANARAVYGQLTPLKLWDRLRRAERERKNPEWLGELKGRLK